MIHTASTIDTIPDSVCEYVILHSKEFSWNFLALKISLTRLNLKIAMMKNRDSAIRDCCAELKTLLKKSVAIPNAQNDISRILEIKP
ncbi:MAG: hypothetical protein LBF89_07370 [Bacteroidales bacterium]|jgi:hypothetical protein|nr:hypothetical protein [Bacteroidales bacterium]